MYWYFQYEYPMLGAEAGRAPVRRQRQRKSRRTEEIAWPKRPGKKDGKESDWQQLIHVKKKTRDASKSYLNSIHDWYFINRSELCSERDELIFEKVTENCKLWIWLCWLMRLIVSNFFWTRGHISVNFKTTQKQCRLRWVGVGTYPNCTGVPYEYNQCLKGYFTGLKNGE